MSGSVIHQTTGQGIAGLRVEAWDKDLIFNDLVGSAVTDAQGKFQVEFTESHFRGIFFDRRPDLFFKVFNGRHVIKSTEDSVLWNVNTADLALAIEVDVATDSRPGPPQYQLKRGPSGKSQAAHMHIKADSL
jgi:hypothetical protein